MTDAEMSLIAERAAIIEFDAGLHRYIAEKQAFLDVLGRPEQGSEMHRLRSWKQKVNEKSRR